MSRALTLPAKPAWRHPEHDQLDHQLKQNAAQTEEVAAMVRSTNAQLDEMRDRQRHDAATGYNNTLEIRNALAALEVKRLNASSELSRISSRRTGLLHDKRTVQDLERRQNNRAIADDDAA